MKHVTYGDKAFFLDDDLAAAVMEYASRLADDGRADTVTVPAVTSDGNVVETTLLLTTSTPIATESTDVMFETVPADPRVLADLRQRAAALGIPHAVELSVEELPDDDEDI